MSQGWRIALFFGVTILASAWVYLPYSQYVKRYTLTHGLSDEEQRNLLWGNGGRQLDIMFERQTDAGIERLRRSALIRLVLSSVGFLLFLFLGLR